MIQTKVEKDFDCLEFKQKAQEEAFENIKNLTPKKQIKYYRTVAESSSLGDWWKAVKSNLRGIILMYMYNTFARFMSHNVV